MKVVITGARGYIGSALTHRLTQLGHSVVALSRTQIRGEFACVTSGEVGSLRSHMVGAEGVVHLAGKLVENAHAPIAEYLDANVLFTDDVMAAAIAAEVHVVVHASSRLVYPSTLTAPAHESDARPDTPYGLSKLWAEELVRFHCDRSKMSGVSLRIAQVTGGEHPGLGVINAFVRQASETGIVRVLGDGIAIRDIVHVRDVIEALVKALEYRGEWRAVNIGGPSPISISGLADAVVSAAGADRVRIVHEATASEDRSCYALEQSASRKHLGWSPTVDTEEIVAEAWRERVGTQ